MNSKTRVEAIETNMNAKHEATEEVLKEAFIELSHELCEARDLIADDAEFTKWWKEHTPFESEKTVNTALVFSRAITDGTITPELLKSKMGQAHPVEIKDASIEVQTAIEDMIQAGKTPTIKAIRELKQKYPKRAKYLKRLPPPKAKKKSVAKYEVVTITDWDETGEVKKALGIVGQITRNNLVKEAKKLNDYETRMEGTTEWHDGHDEQDRICVLQITPCKAPS